MNLQNSNARSKIQAFQINSVLWLAFMKESHAMFDFFYEIL